jgi:hypothetical protein
MSEHVAERECPHRWTRKLRLCRVAHAHHRDDASASTLHGPAPPILEVNGRPPAINSGISKARCYLGVPASFQSMMLTSFQGFLLS